MDTIVKTHVGAYGVIIKDNEIILAKQKRLEVDIKES